MQAALAILPVIALVALGHLARRFRIIAPENWPGVEQLGFRLLFPAILLTSIYRSELSLGALGPYVLGLSVAFAATGLAAILTRRPLRLRNPRFTSMFQGSMRFNSLLVLAVAANGLGPAALSDLAVAMAFLIPVFNISSIIMLALFPPENDHARLTSGRRQTWRRITTEIARNPLVLGCLAGLVLNVTGVTLPDWVLAPLDWLGQGALAVGLLSVGAGIEIRRLWQSDPAMWIGVAMRLAMCPALFLLIAMMLGLPSDQIASGVLLTAAPAASVGFILARQMGGDADFYADMFTWQTVLSALTLSLWLILVGHSAT